MQQLSLLIVMLAALIIPIIMARFKVSSIPTAIAEIITGIILGKSFLNIVNPNWTLNMMSSMGVIMLMFLSGMEINFDLFRKTPGKKREFFNLFKHKIKIRLGHFFFLNKFTYFTLDD